MSLCSSVFKHPFSCLHNKKTVRNKYSLFRTVYLPISIQLFLFCCLCGMLLDKLLLQIVRYKLVACKLGCKRGSTACQTTQRDRVVAQFLQRNLSLKLLITSLAIHTHNQGAASLKVAHHVAHIVGRHINLEVVYRLKNLRTSLLECCRERVAGCKHERELVRVNRGCILPSYTITLTSRA